MTPEEVIAWLDEYRKEHARAPVFAMLGTSTSGKTWFVAALQDMKYGAGAPEPSPYERLNGQIVMRQTYEGTKYISKYAFNGRGGFIIIDIPGEMFREGIGKRGLERQQGAFDTILASVDGFILCLPAAEMLLDLRAAPAETIKPLVERGILRADGRVAANMVVSNFNRLANLIHSLSIANPLSAEAAKSLSTAQHRSDTPLYVVLTKPDVYEQATILLGGDINEDYDHNPVAELQSHADYLLDSLNRFTKYTVGFCSSRYGHQNLSIASGKAEEMDPLLPSFAAGQVIDWLRGARRASGLSLRLAEMTRHLGNWTQRHMLAKFSWAWAGLLALSMAAATAGVWLLLAQKPTLVPGRVLFDPPDITAIEKEWLNPAITEIQLPKARFARWRAIPSPNSKATNNVYRIAVNDVYARVDALRIALVDNLPLPNLERLADERVPIAYHQALNSMFMGNPAQAIADTDAAAIKQEQDFSANTEFDTVNGRRLLQGGIALHHLRGRAHLEMAVATQDANLRSQSLAASIAAYDRATKLACHLNQLPGYRYSICDSAPLIPRKGEYEYLIEFDAAVLAAESLTAKMLSGSLDQALADAVRLAVSNDDVLQAHPDLQARVSLMLLHGGQFQSARKIYALNPGAQGGELALVQRVLDGGSVMCSDAKADWKEPEYWYCVVHWRKAIAEGKLNTVMEEADTAKQNGLPVLADWAYQVREQLCQAATRKAGARTADQKAQESANLIAAGCDAPLPGIIQLALYVGGGVVILLLSFLFYRWHRNWILLLGIFIDGHWHQRLSWLSAKRGENGEKRRRWLEVAKAKRGAVP